MLQRVNDTKMRHGCFFGPAQTWSGLVVTVPSPAWPGGLAVPRPPLAQRVARPGLQNRKRPKCGPASPIPSPNPHPHPYPTPYFLNPQPVQHLAVLHLGSSTPPQASTAGGRPPSPRSSSPPAPHRQTSMPFYGAHPASSMLRPLARRQPHRSSSPRAKRSLGAAHVFSELPPS